MLRVCNKHVLGWGYVGLHWQSRHVCCTVALVHLEVHLKHLTKLRRQGWDRGEFRLGINISKAIWCFNCHAFVRRSAEIWSVSSLVWIQKRPVMASKCGQPAHIFRFHVIDIRVSVFDVSSLAIAHKSVPLTKRCCSLLHCNGDFVAFTLRAEFKQSWWAGVLMCLVWPGNAPVDHANLFQCRLACKYEEVQTSRDHCFYPSSIEHAVWKQASELHVGSNLTSLGSAPMGRTRLCAPKAASGHELQRWVVSRNVKCFQRCQQCARRHAALPFVVCSSVPSASLCRCSVTILPHPEKQKFRCKTISEAESKEEVLMWIHTDSWMDTWLMELDFAYSMQNLKD